MPNRKHNRVVDYLNQIDREVNFFETSELVKIRQSIFYTDPLPSLIYP